MRRGLWQAHWHHHRAVLLLLLFGARSITYQRPNGCPVRSMIGLPVICPFSKKNQSSVSRRVGEFSLIHKPFRQHDFAGVSHACDLCPQEQDGFRNPYPSTTVTELDADCARCVVDDDWLISDPDAAVMPAFCGEEQGAVVFDAVPIIGRRRQRDPPRFARLCGNRPGAGTLRLTCAGQRPTFAPNASKTGLELRVCKPHGVSVSLKQDSKWRA
jgi:hypothetical protein